MSGKGAKGLSGKGLSGKGAKGTMKGGDKKKPTSRSVKAGLQFPVGRIHRFLKVRFRRIHHACFNRANLCTPRIWSICTSVTSVIIATRNLRISRRPRRRPRGVEI
jgi:hypothetical protein